MKILRIIALIFAALIISIFIYSLFIPSEYVVKRSINILAKREIVLSYINNLKSWQEWSTWTNKKDSSIKFTYKGPEAGAGSIQMWNSSKMGKGYIKIIQSNNINQIKYILKIEDEGYESNGKFDLIQTTFGTKISWEIKGHVGWNPIAKIFSYFYMDKYMGSDLERALRNLKMLIESRNQV